jgi:competence protein ComEA
MQERNSFKNFFTYSKKEIRGIIVLISLIGGLVLIRYVRNSRSENFDLVYEKEMPGNDSSLINPVLMENKNKSGSKYIRQTVISAGKFDPNRITYIDLIHRGFSKMTAANILKYRKKGGIFKCPEDLLKIYGIDSAIVRAELSNILIDQAYIIDRRSRDLTRADLKSKIEINSADSSRLIRINGIGGVLAKRIIKYRGLLGGFYSVNQLRDVYGVSDSLLSALSLQVEIDSGLIRKININTCSFYDLKRHPYIGDYTAKMILNYRNLMGTINSMKQIIENHILTKEAYNKVSPYIRFN